MKAALAAIFTACLAGCTVLPDAVQGSAGSYSGNDANAGVLSVGADGVHVSVRTEARYEALVAIYGKGLASHPFLPALGKGTGVTALPDGTFVMDREHFADFGLMAAWARSGTAP